MFINIFDKQIYNLVYEIYELCFGVNVVARPFLLLTDQMFASADVEIIIK